jgi:TonB family protein
MQNNNLYRSLLLVGWAAVLWSTAAASPAANLHPLVVTGIPLDNVASAHPIPAYPRMALALGIEGRVAIRVQVENGRITEVKAVSGSPVLGYSAQEWIVRSWKFKPDVSGLFTIPISYQAHASVS